MPRDTRPIRLTFPVSDPEELCDLIDTLGTCTVESVQVRRFDVSATVPGGDYHWLAQVCQHLADLDRRRRESEAA